MTRASRSASSSCSRKKFDVFEFNEDDEHVEKASVRLLDKFGNPKKGCNSRKSPVNKYKFLEFFAQGSKTFHEESSTDPIEVDEEGPQGVKTLDKEISNDPIEVDLEGLQETKCLQKELGNRASDFDTCSMSHQIACATSCSIAVEPDAVKEEISRVDDFLHFSSNSGNESLGMVSAEDDRIETSSSSPSTLSAAESEVSLENQVYDHGSGAFEIDISNMLVNVFPDFILYGDIYSTSSCLTFSCSCIRLEGSTINGTEETFSFEWEISNISKIESDWSRRVETAIIKLRFNSKGSGVSGIGYQNAGFEQLTFAVYDPCWSKGEEAIRSLDLKYQDLWTVTFDSDTDENVFPLGQNSLFSPKHYFPVFGENFEDIIFPKEDPDPVSISKRDVELLQPETFINDTIIDFYIKYLQNKIQPGERNRFYFFNSFFFRKLADLDKDPSSASDGRVAFQRVRRWTRKINVFEKDYIFIPVNYSLHWSLIVICHPGEMTCFKDEEIENSPRVPCILHMDSLKGSHSSLKNVIQSYLCEEWKERHSKTGNDDSSKFLDLRFVPLELPQQENLFDCGLFLLHYLELFLEEAPINFSPFKITQVSNFLSRNWFPPAEASLKRVCIQRLIYEILDDHSQKACTADGGNKYPHSHAHDMFKDEMGVEYFDYSCHSIIRHGTSFNLNADQGVETPLPPASSPSGAPYTEPGLALTELLEEGAAARASDTNFQLMAASQGPMSPIKEIEEINDQTASLPLDVEAAHQVSVLASEFPSTSYFEEQVKQNSFSGTSITESLNSLEVGAHGDHPLVEFEGSKLPDKEVKHESSSTSSEELAGCVVEDSQERNIMRVNEDTSSPPSIHGEIFVLSCSNADSAENREDDASVSKEELSELNEQDAKRPRLMHPGGERRFTRGPLKELHV
ncbi:putative Sentrin/sumo-specific protease [Quillaja saponaria]|uniref:Sentrin/sumo-specific protease n=1 Tax=Quillaja saponaria TaxID=32244 RepID=A0AAD7M415_QUISA|nr:putative Sentrin/sumo-specific protease [Quillaja saponaria]